MRAIFVLVIFSLFLCLSLSQSSPGDPTLPDLPRAFSVMVESNFLEDNSTAYTFGYYDYHNNRFRIEQHTQTSAVVIIFLREQRISYRLVVGTTDCTTTKNVDSVDIIDGEFFFFATQDVKNYVYQGKNNSRGINTDAWSGTYTGPDPSKPNLTSSFTLWYQFAVSEWRMITGSNAAGTQYRTPVKATLEGNSTLPDGTVVPLSRQYNFMDFFYGNFTDTLFDKPYACSKGETYTKSEAFTAGGIAGVVVAGVIILAAIFGRIIYLRRNPISNRGHRLADDAVM